MKIISVKIHGLKRFMLNGIKTVTYEPEKKLQVIVGTNGSGKSSLLNELTPLPPNRKDYHNGGFKIIRIEHFGTYFELTFTINPTPKFQFICDGESLNPGQTRQVQLKLVKDCFHITPQIHDIFTGKELFTRMALGKRREWFSLLDTNDLDFALSLYKKIKERQRDAAAIVRSDEIKLNNEKNKLINADRERILQQEIEELRKESLLLNQQKSRVEKSYPELNNLHTRLKDKLEISLSKLEQVKKTLKISQVEEDSIAEKLMALEADFKAINIFIKLHQKKFDEKSEIFNVLKNKQVFKASDIKTEITSLKEQIDSTESVLTKDLIFLSIEFIRWFNQYQDELQELDEQLTSLLWIYEKHTSLENIEQKIKQEQSRIKKHQDIIQKNSNKDHLISILQEDEIVCPSCHEPLDLNKFKDGATLDNKDNDIIYAAQKMIETLEGDLESLREFLWGLKRFNDVVRIFNEERFLEVISERPGAIIESIGTNHDKLNLLSTHIEELKTLIVFKQKLIEKESLVKTIEKEDVESYLRLKDEMEVIDGEIAIKLKEKNILSGKITELKKVFSFYKEKMELESQISSIRDKIIETKEMIDKLIENQRLNKLIYQNDQRKDTLEEQLQIQTQTLQFIKIHEENLGKERLRNSLLHDVEKTLSPKEGLIGESILSSMGSFLDSVNRVIEKIWSYEITVKPCVLDDEFSLSYRFPVKIGHSQEVDDINLCSASQQEIINMAFKIVMMTRLKLHNYPLFLDEFGASFDSHHREVAFRMIHNEIALADEFSQIFMVSHYLENYGFSNDNDLVVLGSDNIDVAIQDHKTNTVFMMD